MRYRSAIRKALTRSFARLPLSAHTRLRLGAMGRAMIGFDEEQRIGFRPFFQTLTHPWLSPLLPLSYTRVWAHLNVIGMNYVSVSLAKRDSPVLALFDPLSPYYQAWFGVYTVKSDFKPFGFEDGRPNPERLALLIVADQEEWQRRITGRAIPGSTFISQSKPQEITLGGVAKKAFMFTGRLASHSVLIPPEKQAADTLRYFRLPRKEDWDKLVDAAHPLHLSGFAIFWIDDTRALTFCAYGVGASFTDNRGQNHEYLPTIEPELRKLLEHLRFRAA